MLEALLYTKEDMRAVSCQVCARKCRIAVGAVGACGVRENRGGILHPLYYGTLVAACVDPVEKKPLFHFLPGSTTFSIASAGCNFQCVFCQNWQISQADQARALGTRGDACSPEDAVQLATQHACPSISFTYTEPTVSFEFMLETARLARARGLKTIMVTNGFMSPEACSMLAPFLDAANIDLKAGSDEFYRDMCGARIQPVKDTIAALYDAGVWIEVTTLLIPGKNDTPREARAITGFLAGIDTDIPWHISKFFPQYKMAHVLPHESCQPYAAAREIAGKAGLSYVYSGALHDAGGENTYCGRCGKGLIMRRGYCVTENHIAKGCCAYCGHAIAGCWE